MGEKNNFPKNISKMEYHIEVNLILDTVFNNMFPETFNFFSLFLIFGIHLMKFNIKELLSLEPRF